MVNGWMSITGKRIYATEAGKSTIHDGYTRFSGPNGGDLPFRDAKRDAISPAGGGHRMACLDAGHDERSTQRFGNQTQNSSVWNSEHLLVRNVRKHLPEEIQSMITFAYITGWRMRSEIWPLQWPLVDFKAKIVRLEPGTTKNDKGRIFPFTAEIGQLLEAQRAKTDKLQKKKGVIIPWVFHRDGRPVKEFKRSWKTACKDAGLPGRIPHDFRRTAVRNPSRSGIIDRVAMQMTGHKTRSIYDRYNILNEADPKEAAEKLNQHLKTGF
jgi:integrase